MPLLIDGYNLLHATDVFGSGALAGTLQGSREALLAELAARLPERERARARVVFDAAGAPPGLPDTVGYAGLTVLYARDFADADAMLESLIERERAPKELLVVSSDRRVQRAARRRGAAWVESDAWWRGLRPSAAGVPHDGAAPGGVGDPDEWVRAFSDPKTLAALEADTGTAQRPAALPADLDAPAPPGGGRAPGPDGDPFPPGYADDLQREWDATRPPWET